MKINESGRSMIEMLGVLAIIGVLSVGGIAGYSKAMSKYRVNKTIDQISHIAANTRILFSAQKDYSALGGTNKDNIIKKAKLYPDDLLNSALTVAAVTNPFAGSVSISPSGRFGSGDGKAFVIAYGNIPEEACVDLLTIDWGTGTAGGIIALGTDGGETGNVGTQENPVEGIVGGVGNQYAGNCTDTVINNDTENAGYNGGKVISCGAMSVKAAVHACKGDGKTLYFKFY